MNDPKTIVNLVDTDIGAPKGAPPLVVMSLSLRTVMNHHKNSNEIVAVTGLVYNNGKICLSSQCRWHNSRFKWQ